MRTICIEAENPIEGETQEPDQDTITVIAGPPRSGKTWLLRQMVQALPLRTECVVIERVPEIRHHGSRSEHRSVSPGQELTRLKALRAHILGLHRAPQRVDAIAIGALGDTTWPIFSLGARCGRRVFATLEAENRSDAKRRLRRLAQEDGLPPDEIQNLLAPVQLLMLTKPSKTVQAHRAQ